MGSDDWEVPGAGRTYGSNWDNLKKLLAQLSGEERGRAGMDEKLKHMEFIDQSPAKSLKGQVSLRDAR
jgi:hypothetical protein